MKLIKYSAYKQKHKTMKIQQLTQSLISLLERNGEFDSNSILTDNIPFYVLGLTQEGAELTANTIENREAIPLGLDRIDDVHVEELPVFISKDFLAVLISLIEIELNDVANTSELIEKLRSTLTVEELKAVKLREIIEAKDSEIKECKDAVSMYVENIEELKNKISTLSNTAEYDKLYSDYKRAVLAVNEKNELIDKIKSMGLIKRIFSLPKLLK